MQRRLRGKTTPSRPASIVVVRWAPSRLRWRPFGARAQSDFPNRPLKIIVPQPPGGGFDFVGRTLADSLQRALGQSVVVENRPGSGTLVGTDAAAKSAPDGYTLLVGSVSNLVLNVGLYPSLPYEPQRDFEPIGVAVAYSYTLMGRKDLGLDSLAEVLKQAKAKPRALTYASAGNGSGQHVLAAATWHSAGVELVHVPYRGAQAAYQDLLGGRVDLFFDLAPTARTQFGAGTVKALATSGAQRNPMHPDVPTLREARRRSRTRIVVRFVRARAHAGTCGAQHACATSCSARRARARCRLSSSKPAAVRWH